MDVKQILLADYTNVSVEGKLNALGIFSNINAVALPVIHPQLHLIVMWTASRTEVGKRKKIELQLADSDGNKLLTIGGEVEIPDGKPGRLIAGNFIFPMIGLTFQKWGSYAFHVLVNDDDKGSVGFEVTEIKETQ